VDRQRNQKISFGKWTTMTESDYIIATNLAKLRAANHILHEVFAAEKDIEQWHLRARAIVSIDALIEYAEKQIDINK